MKWFHVSSFTPYTNMQEEWKQRIRMIHEAKEFIYASTYFIQCDSYGKEYIAALSDANKRGVRVVLLIDSFGQKLSQNLMNHKEIQELRASIAMLRMQGINIIYYRCASHVQRFFGSGMHIKIQLSDGGGALFSSGNISSTSYDLWREFSAYVEGAIVVRLLEEFISLGVAVESQHIAHLSARIHAQDISSIGYISYNPACDKHIFNPVILSSPNVLTQYIASAIAGAQQHICITSLYFKPAPLLLV